MTGIEFGALAAAAGSAVTAAAPYVAVASTVLGAVSSIAAGNQQSAALQQTATTQRINAGAALNTAEADAARQEDRARRQAATATNQAAGSGVDINSGSPLDLMADTASQGALDSEITRWRGATQAGAYLTSGAQSLQQADQAQTAGWINAGTTLLTSAAKYATPVRARVGNA